MINKICIWCGKGFKIYPSQSNRKCCSIKCGYKYRDSKAIITSICKVCKKDILHLKCETKVTCSKKCFRELRRIYTIGKNNPMYGKKHKESTKIKVGINRGDYPKKELNPNWRGGISKVTPYRNKEWKKQRILAWQKYEHICNRCGSFRNLVVDHIVPCFVKEDHRLSNLQIFCNRCNIKKAYEDFKKYGR